jgi:hypothetical protein
MAAFHITSAAGNDGFAARKDLIVFSFVLF